jgi:RND family efflux transporter MFP subunit
MMRTFEPTGRAAGEQASEELPSKKANVDRLIEENLALKRQLEELKAGPSSHGRSQTPLQLWRPSSVTIWAIILGVAVLLIVAFIAGYVPMRKQRGVIAGEALSRQEALPRAEVMEVRRAPSDSELELPGSIQAITEAPLLARASGYIKQRFGDIGDRVKAGQALAQIDAPELDQQVIEAKANLQQAHAVLDESNASYEQGKANLDLAKVSAERWKQLLARGVVSRQENDTYSSQYNAQLAGVRSLERAIAAQEHTVSATDANLSRLKQMQDFETVRAPFDGIITLRNVDSGTLVTAGNTLLFRIAQINILRTYLNVPQANSASIHAGQKAALRVSSLSGVFEGTVARTANSLDPASRTLLVEVHVQNPTGALMPGMYAQVNLATERPNPPLLVPSDALIVRPGANLIAVLRPDHTVHLQTVEVGRDYGDRLEILRGLEEGTTIIPIPGDLAREGLKIDPVVRPRPAAATGGTK